MPEPALNSANRNASFVVESGKGLSKAMQLEPLAYGLRCATPTGLVVAVTAVHTGVEGEGLESSQEVAIWFPLRCGEDQPRPWITFAPIPQYIYQRVRNRDRSFLGVLRGPSQVELLGYGERFRRKVHVAPRGV